MSNVSAHHNIAMHHEVDPKEKLFAEIGDLSKFEVFNTGVLLAVYVRPEKTKSGFYLTDKTREEDRYQSKVGLVVRKGPSAFVESDGKWFDGLNIDVGDWLVFRPSDGWNITVHGVLCRMCDDASFKMRIPHPDEVY